MLKVIDRDLPNGDLVLLCAKFPGGQALAAESRVELGSGNGKTEFSNWTSTGLLV